MGTQQMGVREHNQIEARIEDILYSLHSSDEGCYESIAGLVFSRNLPPLAGKKIRDPRDSLAG
jgi:hypothetical protein